MNHHFFHLILLARAAAAASAATLHICDFALMIRKKYLSCLWPAAVVVQPPRRHDTVRYVVVCCIRGSAIVSLLDMLHHLELAKKSYINYLKHVIMIVPDR